MAEETKQPRRIRKVETVREKAEKTAAASDRPQRLRGVRRIIGAPFRMAAKGIRKLGRYKVFRIIGYILVPPYFRNSWRELRQVTWPSGRESRQLTLAVILFAFVFGALVTVADYGLDKVFKQVLLK